MSIDISRRHLMKGALSTALVPASFLKAASVPFNKGGGMPVESADTPKIAAPISVNNISDETMRQVKQIGVDHVLMGGPPMPWTEARLREITDKLSSGGLKPWNMMIGGFPNTLYGRPGRDEEIEKFKQSVRAAGKVGLPVIEYNFYAHRAIEGYYAQDGRGGAGLTAFDAERVKGLAALDNEGAHDLDSMWNNISYFLKAVIPTAEESNVRLALHPNDPPVAISRGSAQIMGTVEGWKHLVGIVDSPANGITFDCGVTREMGEDPVEVCRYFGSRDRINHVHYRNVKVRKPYDDYTEVFIDEGDNDMLAIMRELVKVKYRRLIYPEHERALDYDRKVGIHNQYPGGGGYAGMVYDIGYARAMLQSALILERT